MLLGEAFERFAAESPVSVMARAAFEHALPADAVDALFAEHADRQYTRELLFSQLVDLMGLVVCRVQPSLNAAIRKRAADLRVTRKAVYAKIARIEPELGAALVRHTAARLAPVVTELGLGPASGVPGFRVRVIDGSHLPGTDHRLGPLRRTRAAALPGQAVVLFDPAGGLIVDAIPCEDAHAQERSLTAAVLDRVEPGLVWVGDRNFCTAQLLAGTAGRGGCFAVRQHGQTLTELGAEGRVNCGRTATGVVFEEAVRVSDGAGGELGIRGGTVAVDAPTPAGGRGGGGGSRGRSGSWPPPCTGRWPGWGTRGPPCSRSPSRCARTTCWRRSSPGSGRPTGRPPGRGCPDTTSRTRSPGRAGGCGSPSRRPSGR